MATEECVAAHYGQEEAPPTELDNGEQGHEERGAMPV